jgi:hypothetical protein
MVDALAWMGVFLGFAALAMAGNAMRQISALRAEVEKLKAELRRSSSS